MSTFSSSDAHRRPGSWQVRAAHRRRGTRGPGRFGAHRRLIVPPARATSARRHDRPAEHRIILIVDVEAFTDSRRNNKHQKTVRAALYRILRRAFGEAGISWERCKHEDRGDSVFTLAPAVIHKAPFVDRLPARLAALLRQHNKKHEAEERIRLRMALHAGEVEFDQYGATSTAINQAFRLLQANSLKEALKASPGTLVMIVSEWYFDEVVRHSAHVDHRTFRRVEADTSDPERALFGWISAPDAPYEIEIRRRRRTRRRLSLLSVLLWLFRR